MITEAPISLIRPLINASLNVGIKLYVKGYKKAILRANYTRSDIKSIQIYVLFLQKVADYLIFFD